MIHPLLNAALAHVPSAESYRPRAHLAGPMPIVPRLAHVRIARWCAGRAAPYVHASMASLVDECLMHIDALVVVDEDIPTIGHAGVTDDRMQAISGAGHADDRMQAIVRAAEAIEVQALNVPAYGRAIEVQASNVPADVRASVGRLFLSAWDEAAAIVLAAAHVACSLDGSLRHIGRRSRVVAACTAKLLVTTQPDLAPAFVAALDEQLLRAELAWAARRHVPQLAQRLVELRLRRADSAGAPCLWILRLRDGHGALVRENGFRWVEGPPDVVLATVPDEHRPAAAAALSRS